MIYKTNFKKKILATLFDYGIYVTFFVIYVNALGTPSNDGRKTVEGITALPLLLFWIVYFVVIEGIDGATLGHHLFKLKVVKLNGERIGLREALKRHLLDGIDLFFYGIPAFITIRNTEKRQRIGDLWAKTFVVDLNDPDQQN